VLTEAQVHCSSPYADKQWPKHKHVIEKALLYDADAEARDDGGVRVECFGRCIPYINTERNFMGPILFDGSVTLIAVARSSGQYRYKNGRGRQKDVKGLRRIMKEQREGQKAATRPRRRLS
jgi:hypothetical protein